VFNFGFDRIVRSDSTSGEYGDGQDDNGGDSDPNPPDVVSILRVLQHTLSTDRVVADQRFSHPQSARDPHVSFNIRWLEG
jgi:hypothetical protein